MKTKNHLCRALAMAGAMILGLAHPSLAAECPAIHWLNADGERSPSNFKPWRESVIFIHGFQLKSGNIFDITPRPQPDVESSNSGVSCGSGGECFSYAYFVAPEHGPAFNFGIYYWKALVSSSPSSTEDHVWDDNSTMACGAGELAHAVERFKQQYGTVAAATPRRIHLVAHSMGTHIALRFLEKVAQDPDAEAPFAVTLLDPGWVQTDTARSFAQLVESLVDGPLLTAIVMGKSTHEYYWLGDPTDVRKHYRAASVKVFDFWLDGDFDGAYPQNHGSWKKTNFETRHRRIVKFWFEDLAPGLGMASCGQVAWTWWGQWLVLDRACNALFGMPQYPYRLGRQCGPWKTEAICLLFRTGYQCWPQTFPWHERIEQAKGERLLSLRLDQADPKASCFVSCSLTNAGLVDQGSCR